MSSSMTKEFNAKCKIFFEWLIKCLYLVIYTVWWLAGSFMLMGFSKLTPHPLHVSSCCCWKLTGKWRRWSTPSQRVRARGSQACIESTGTIQVIIDQAEAIENKCPDALVCKSMQHGIRKGILNYTDVAKVHNKYTSSHAHFLILNK